MRPLAESEAARSGSRGVSGRREEDRQRLAVVDAAGLGARAQQRPMKRRQRRQAPQLQPPSSSSSGAIDPPCTWYALRRPPKLDRGLVPTGDESD